MYQLLPFSTPLSPDQWDPEVDQLAVHRDSATGVVELVLTNPAQRNAMSAAMTEAWDRLMPALAADRDVRAVLVRGADGGFCSGGDTGGSRSHPDAAGADLRERMLPFYRTWLAIRSIPVPTIAALEGSAIGAGACLALACDLRYATTAARFAVPFTHLGMHAGMAATWLLPDVVGMAVARDLLLTGRTVEGDELREIGLASQVFPVEGFVASVRERAQRVAAGAPVATRLTVAALRDGGPTSFEASVQWEALAQPITLATDDLAEGLTAARERRPARFTGR